MKAQAFFTRKVGYLESQRHEKVNAWNCAPTTHHGLLVNVVPDWKKETTKREKDNRKMRVSNCRIFADFWKKKSVRIFPFFFFIIKEGFRKY